LRGEPLLYEAEYPNCLMRRFDEKLQHITIFCTLCSAFWVLLQQNWGREQLRSRAFRASGPVVILDEAHLVLLSQAKTAERIRYPWLVVGLRHSLTSSRLK